MPIRQFGSATANGLQKGMGLRHPNVRKLVLSDSADVRSVLRWQAGGMHAALFILYVTDQTRARDFYRHVLAAEPVLDVPGMTEFDLGGATLDLMPAADLEALLPGQIRAGADQRCELYLRRGDATAALARAVDGDARLLDGLRDRSWGERVGYLLDPDGHVLAMAAAGPTDKAR